MDTYNSNPHSPQKQSTPAKEAPMVQETLPSSVVDNQDVSRLMMQQLTKLPQGH